MNLFTTAAEIAARAAGHAITAYADKMSGMHDGTDATANQTRQALEGNPGIAEMLEEHRIQLWHAFAARNVASDQNWRRALIARIPADQQAAINRYLGGGSNSIERVRWYSATGQEWEVAGLCERTGRVYLHASTKNGFTLNMKDIGRSWPLPEQTATMLDILESLGAIRPLVME